jgi:hypothetical protein
MKIRYREFLFGKDLDGGVHELGEGTIAATLWRD